LQAAILGGLGSPLGAFVGALIIGVVSELSTLGDSAQLPHRHPLCVIALIPDHPSARSFRPALYTQMISFIILISIVVCFSAILALALNFQWGLGGMVNFGLAGLYALGAYSCALLMLKGGANTFFATLGAMAIVALVCGITRVRDAARHRRGLLRDRHARSRRDAAAGRAQRRLAHQGRARPHRHPRPLGDVVPPEYYQYFLLGLSVVLVCATVWFLNVIARSPFGRIVRAVREDDVVAATLGKHVLWARDTHLRDRRRVHRARRLAACVLLSVHRPDPVFQHRDCLCVHGRDRRRAGRAQGVIWGAAAVMVLLEGLALCEGPDPALDSDQLSAIRIIMIGVGLIALLIFRPQGSCASIAAGRSEVRRSDVDRNIGN
jgi:ABC-type branched-subunit amino acid transport system permease subunit